MANVEPVSDIPQNFVEETAAQDYVRLEAMVPMRDGVRLYTLVLIPKAGPAARPLLMTRTPYGVENVMKSGFSSPRLAANMSLAEQEFLDAGYIRVFQDVRGKFKSEGVYQMYRPPGGPGVNTEVDHVTDTWDTIEWLLANVPGHNGHVGMIGVSYPGYLALIPLMNPHPALKATVPVNAVVDAWMGDDFYHNGAFRLSELEYFYRQTASKDNALKPPYGHYDVYRFYLDAASAEGAAKRLWGNQTLPAWERMAANTTYNAQWQANALDVQLERIPVLTVPVLNVHAWFDAEDIYGPIAAYSALQKKDFLGNKNFLAAGPWIHGQCMHEGSSAGAIKWDANTSKQFRNHVLLPFLDLHLKGIEPKRPIARVTAFRTGSNDWHEFESWPPPEAAPAPFHFNAGERLNPEPPADNVRSAFDAFVSDPAKPVPYRVRPILSRYRQASTWGIWLLDDQRPFENRPDVLAYSTPPLDHPVTIAGPVTGRLFAATTGTDADWVVKLIDVYPDEFPAQPELGGYQLMISAGILRGRYRNSFEWPNPLIANETLEYAIRMPHAHHTFLRGHRIMVQVQSTWFPLFDRNPQHYVPSIYNARAQDFRAATHRIYRGAGGASGVELNVMG